MTEAHPAPSADRRQVAAFRDLLRRAGFTRDGIQARLGVAGDVLARPAERPVYLRRLGSDGALETLIRLFLLDAPVETAIVEPAIAPTDLQTLVALGLVDERGGEVRAAVRLVPHGDIVVASDLPDLDGRHADHVAGLHRPSVTLADLTVRRPVGAALDVGTGCGIQAMLASRHAQRVVATDVNERALAFAALNAALNGADNVEFRLGSFFEPVAGESFGLVVCNPPYVISPESAYVFRDSGLGRDRVSERLVGEMPGFLDDGAFGTIMVSWVASPDDATTRPRGWLDGAGCDAWILHTAVEDPITAAAAWNADQAGNETRYAQAIDRWLEYFRAEAIEAIAYGAIVLRRRAGGSNWVRERELPNEPRPEPAGHVLRLFTGPDLSDRLSNDAALAAQALALAEGATIESRLRRAADGWSEVIDVTLAIGIPFSAELDRFTADLLVQLDGSRPLGEVLDEFARLHEAPPERVRAGGLRIARQLLELGFAVSPDANEDPEKRD